MEIIFIPCLARSLCSFWSCLGASSSVLSPAWFVFLSCSCSLCNLCPNCIDLVSVESHPLEGCAGEPWTEINPLCPSGVPIARDHLAHTDFRGLELSSHYSPMCQFCSLWCLLVPLFQLLHGGAFSPTPRGHSLLAPLEQPQGSDGILPPPESCF